MTLETLTLGLWQANCHLLGDRDSGAAVVVDPGQDGAPAVAARLQALGLRAEAVLLTHGHLDHLWSAPELAAELDVPVFLHDDDRWLWDNPAAGFGDVPLRALEDELGLRWDPDPSRLEPIRDGQSLRLGGLRFVVRHTPGHTPGSCVFLTDDLGDDPVLLSGDLLFAGSVGRTDLPGGSWDQEMASLARVVLPLDDATVVLPGHGPATTVGAERVGNPYLRQLA
ncbi:MAG TPA: MBL fold metallo-hydrolase [Egibacteraceae bacterium]